MKIKYRPEIDGLRAISVLVIIIYHLKLDKVLKGGYLGVDVFFVISGFLISFIILKELFETGAFSFYNFYKRRIRRILPLLLVVLLVSTIASWFILLPSQIVTFAKSGLASVLFFSNHFWYISSLEYEAQSSLLEPLLHTWSLSIEEQFYILFPTVLFLIYSYFKKYLFHAIILLTFLSLFFAQYYLHSDSSFCFYLLPSRLWELSAGSLVAIVNLKQKRLPVKSGYLINFNVSYYDYIIWLLLTFSLSHFSYKFIEQPFRNRQKTTSKSFIIFLSSLLFIIIFCFYLLIHNDGFANRFSHLSDMYLGNEIDNSILKQKRDDFYYKVNTEEFYEAGKTKVLFIGDSHAKDLFLSFYLNKEFYPNYSFFKTGDSSWKNKSQSEILKNDLYNSADIVIVCYRFSNKIEFLDPLEDFIAYLKDKNKRVIVSFNTAEFFSFGREEVFDQMISRYQSNITLMEYRDFYKYFYNNRRDYIDVTNQMIFNLVKRMEVEYIDRYSLVCNDDNQECYGVTPSGIKTYTDGSHLSLEGARFFGEKLKNTGCLHKTNFISDESDFIELDSSINVSQIRDENKAKLEELYRKKTDFKDDLKKIKKDTLLTKEELREFKKEEKRKLKELRKKLKKKHKIE